jgi:hypothetical protein
MMQEDQMLHGGQVVHWLLPLSVLAALAGYLGPWVDHPVAGLAILGLDLGEYVKFLTPVRSGAVSLWREGFYLPLVAVSLTCSLAAFRRELAYPWAVRGLLLAAGGGRGAEPAAACVDAAAHVDAGISAAGAGADRALSGGYVLQPAFGAAAALDRCRAGRRAELLAALVLPPWQFFQVLPAIAGLYNQPLALGWGLFVTGLGLGGLLAAAALLALPARTSKTDPLNP